MKKLKIVGAVIVGFVILGVALGFILPAEVNVERDVVINAPQEVSNPSLRAIGFKCG